MRRWGESGGVGEEGERGGVEGEEIGEGERGVG